MGERQVIKGSKGQQIFGLVANTDDPKRSHGNGKPKPGGPFGIGHFGGLPLPASAFTVFEASFNPTAHRVPADIGLVWR